MTEMGVKDVKAKAMKVGAYWKSFLLQKGTSYTNICEKYGIG